MPMGAALSAPSAAPVAELPSPASAAQTADAAAAPAGCSVRFEGDSILRGDTMTAGLLPETPAAGLKRMRPAYTVEDKTISGAYAGMRLAEFLNAAISSRFVVFDYGLNDATQNREYEQPLRAMLQRAKALGRTAIVTGLSRTVSVVPNRDAYDAIARRVAKEEGALFVDWGSVHFDPVEMADSSHPAQPYSTRLTAALVATLDAAAPECAK